MSDQTEVQNETKDAEPEYAIVEVFGHRRHGGRIMEVERFGTKMLRIDVPEKSGDFADGFISYFYGGASIFSLVMTDAATVQRMNKPFAGAGRYLPPADPDDDDEDDDRQEDMGL